MTGNYDKFFAIELFHEYFLSGKCEGIELEPTEDCRALARNIGLQFRFLDNRLNTLMRVNDGHEPFVNSTGSKFFGKYYHNSVFRFYLKNKNPLFFNFTNVDYAFNSGKKCYFSNLSRNKQNGILNLTAPVSDYTAGTTYLPGALVNDPATGNVFEALSKTSSKKKGHLSDPLLWAPKGLLHSAKQIEDFGVSKTYAVGDYAKRPGTDEVFEATKKQVARRDNELDDLASWQPRGKGQLQYLTGNDTTEYCTGTCVFSLSSPVTKADILISGFNFDSAAPDFNVSVLDKETRSFNQPSTQVAINLSMLPAGRYQIAVNKETKMVYYDPYLSKGDIIGVVEIYNHLPATDDYALLDADEKIKGVKYVIQFPNRSVLWRYKPKDGKAGSITDTGDTGYVFRLQGDNFVSDRPIPLSQNVVKTLRLDFRTADFSLFPLPNPNIDRLSRCTQNDFDYLCSDLHLNY